MQGFEQEVPRSIAGEDAPGPVAPVGGRREPNDQDARIRVAEPGNRPAPVLMMGERGALLAGDPLAPFHQSRTAHAVDDLGIQLVQIHGI